MYTSGILPNLTELVLPSKPIDVGSQEANSLRLVRRWKEGRKLLKDHEGVKSGKVKLRTLEVGETGK